MSKTTLTTAASISLMMTLITSPARAQSASGADAEIALLKQQLKLMEQKLDKLQKQTVANTAAAATANAKVDATGAETLTFSDRPELRIDPTQLISTGAIANVSDAQVYGVEAAGAYGPLFFQGEYYWFNVERNAATSLPPIGAPNLKFDGGYAEATFVLTGETHNTTISLARQPALPVDASGSIQPA